MKMLVASAVLAVCVAGPALAQISDRLAALVRAYPDALAGIEGSNLIWRDGTRMPLGDPAPAEDLAEMLQHGSILEQVMMPYPLGDAPAPDSDPGRIRNRAFFDKMYGDCRRNEVAPHLVPVVWLPSSWGHSVRITSVNGVADQLEAISRELDALPAEMKRALYPPGGTYVCRAVADTKQPSMHGWGAAIDINPSFSEYWMWGHRKARGIPYEIVSIFEAHGFIWGGSGRISTRCTSSIGPNCWSARKRALSLKKEPKNLYPLVSQPINKSFLLLFSKKKCFLVSFWRV